MLVVMRFLNASLATVVASDVSSGVTRLSCEFSLFELRPSYAAEEEETLTKKSKFHD